jgi:CheY-like chemotaxis protein
VVLSLDGLRTRLTLNISQPVQKRRVLVVDDDQIIRSVLAEALDDEGYEVQTAINGRDALDRLDGWIPDLIVLDLMMPEIDGWGFRERQRKLDGPAAAIPVLVLSAARELDGHAELMGAAAHIPKPFDLGTLLDRIEQITTPAPHAA